MVSLFEFQHCLKMYLKQIFFHKKNLRKNKRIFQNDKAFLNEPKPV